MQVLLMTQCWQRVADRFDEVVRDLGLELDLAEELDDAYRTIGQTAEAGGGPDYAASCGEYFSGRVMAALLGRPFVDRDGALWADAEAVADAVTQVVGDQPGLAVVDDDGALGAHRNAVAATVALVFVDLDDGAVYQGHRNPPSMVPRCQHRSPDALTWVKPPGIFWVGR